MTKAAQTFEGETYLLGLNVKGDQWVSRYSAADMVEIFSNAERAELAETGKVHQHGKDGGIMWIDMIASARDTFENA